MSEETVENTVESSVDKILDDSKGDFSAAVVVGFDHNNRFCWKASMSDLSQLALLGNQLMFEAGILFNNYNKGIDQKVEGNADDAAPDTD